VYDAIGTFIFATSSRRVLRRHDHLAPDRRRRPAHRATALHAGTGAQADIGAVALLVVFARAVPAREIGVADPVRVAVGLRRIRDERTIVGDPARRRRRRWDWPARLPRSRRAGT
jgi:hypothetical protein